MLITKKNKFSVGEACIKEELCSPAGIPLLRLNLKCPDIQCPERDKLAVFARGFYKKLLNSFAEYARGELLKEAEKAYNAAPEGFVPYAALISYNVTYLDKRFLSVVTDISVSDGNGALSCERKTQVWEREYGTKCKYLYFISKKQLDSVLSESFPDEPKKQIDRDLFALNDNGMVFYLKNECGYGEFEIPYKKITEKF